MLVFNTKQDYFDYIENHPEQKIIIYGVGNETRMNYKYMGHADYFCDQRADEIKLFEGVPCMLPAKLADFQDRITILICIRDKEIVKKIYQMFDDMRVDAEVFYFFDNKSFPYFDSTPYIYYAEPKDRLRIRLVHNDDGWILGKFARKLQEELTKLGQEADIAEEEDASADVNHYIYYGDLTKFYGNYKTIRTTMITHVNCQKLRDQIEYQAHNHVTGICMSSDTLNKLSAWGIPRNRICYVNPAQDGEIKPGKIVLGITNRCYYNLDYRKRDDLILEVCEHLDPAFFKLKIMGSGWDIIVGQLRKLDFEVEYYDAFDKDIYRDLMTSLDYWIYYGFDEGAMGYLDALAAGVKTIATPQGYHLDTKCGLTFPCRTIQDFIDTLKKIQEEKREITDAVKDWTWDNYAKKHLEIWQYLTRSKTMDELYRHQSEYTDGIFSLLIDEIHK